MRLLLDTHILLWALTDPEKLSKPAQRAIADGHNELYLSAASAWEVATKYRIGKLPGAQALVRGYSDHVQRLGAIELPVSAHHALAAGQLSWDHRDPFDRMLAAQAMLESLTLVTVDQVFTGLGGLRML